MLTNLSLTPSRPISDANALAVHFTRNDALIVNMLINNYRVSKILVDMGRSVNILYGGALDMMEDTPKIARTMISPQTQSYLYGFDGNETYSAGTVTLPVRADPYVIMKFYVVDVESPHNAILRRPWLHIMKVIPSTYHHLVRYPTLTGTTDIRGDQAMTRTISAIAGKKFGLRPKNAKTVSDKHLPAGEKRKRVAT